MSDNPYVGMRKERCEWCAKGWPKVPAFLKLGSPIRAVHAKGDDVHPCFAPSERDYITELRASHELQRAEIEKLKAELAEAEAQNWEICELSIHVGKERQRLFDLVRYARHYLHTEKLISNEEYSQILVEGSSGTTDSGSVARLETYDDLKRENAALKQERDALAADMVQMSIRHAHEIDSLSTDNVELRADKERLTKLLSDCLGILEIALRAHPGGAFLNAVCEDDLPRFRAAIDAAREGQKSADEA